TWCTPMGRSIRNCLLGIPRGTGLPVAHRGHPFAECPCNPIKQLWRALCGSSVSAAAADDSVRHHVPGHQLRHIVATRNSSDRDIAVHDPADKPIVLADWIGTDLSGSHIFFATAEEARFFGTPVWNQSPDRKFSLCQTGRARRA